MSEMSNLLTGRELAEYLKLNPATIHRKALNKEIPAIKIGRQFRFDREQIDKWLQQRTLSTPSSILVIDDEPPIGKLLKDFLERYHYEVVAATSSTEAFELIEKQQFDLVFLDLLMPKDNGSQILQEIRKTDAGVPVVVMTDRLDSKAMISVVEREPVMVIYKPVSSDHIMKTVRALLKK